MTLNDLLLGRGPANIGSADIALAVVGLLAAWRYMEPR